MLIPVFVGKLGCDLFKLIGKAVSAGNVIVALKHGGHAVGVLLVQLPQSDAAGIASAACVGHVENIAQAGLIAGGVDERDALAAAPHIAAHLFIPKVVFRTGRRVGTLGVDHDLFVVRVLIQPPSGFQKRHPALMTAGDLQGRMVCHLPVCL